MFKEINDPQNAPDSQDKAEKSDDGDDPSADPSAALTDRSTRGQHFPFGSRIEIETQRGWPGHRLGDGHSCLGRRRRRLGGRRFFRGGRRTCWGSRRGGELKFHATLGAHQARFTLDRFGRKCMGAGRVGTRESWIHGRYFNEGTFGPSSSVAVVAQGDGRGQRPVSDL